MAPNYKLSRLGVCITYCTKMFMLCSTIILKSLSSYAWDDPPTCTYQSSALPFGGLGLAGHYYLKKMLYVIHTGLDILTLVKNNGFVRVCLNFYHLAPSGKFNFCQRYIFRRTASSYAWTSGYIQYSLRAAARSSFFIE